jgi:hypothetical protein
MKDHTYCAGAYWVVDLNPRPPEWNARKHWSSCFLVKYDPMITDVLYDIIESNLLQKFSNLPDGQVLKSINFLFTLHVLYM